MRKFISAMLEKRYVVWHKIIVQNKVLVNEIEDVKEESRCEKIVNVNNHAEFHKIDEKKENAEDMLSWVKSARRFKRSTTKVRCQCIRNLLLVRI